MKFFFLCFVFLVILVLARNPFAFEETQESSKLLATARFINQAKILYFSEHDHENLHVVYQEKSPSTLEKAEGLGG